MIDIFKNIFKTEKQATEVQKTPDEPQLNKIENKELPVKKKKKQVAVKKKTPKEIATEAREPYVSIIKVDLDPDNIGTGSFELDWNEYFVAKLIRSGYKGNDDSQIVDQWFQDVCRNVVLETFEQYDANNPRPPSGVQRKDLGAGRSEIS